MKVLPRNPPATAASRRQRTGAPRRPGAAGAPRPAAGGGHCGACPAARWNSASALRRPQSVRFVRRPESRSTGLSESTWRRSSIGMPPASSTGMRCWSSLPAARCRRRLTAGDDAAEARWVDRDGLAGLNLTEDSRRVIETHGCDAMRAAEIAAALALTIALATPAWAETPPCQRPRGAGLSGGPPAPFRDPRRRPVPARALCGTKEGALWRDQMQALIDSEQPDGEERARMIDRFNRGYESYRSVYRVCTDSARLAVDSLPAGRRADRRRSRGPLRKMMVNR